MDTEAIAKQDESTTSSKSTAGETLPPIKTEEKSFTQEEVNAIVQQRVVKEKEKYPDYELFKTNSGEFAKLTEKYNNLEKTNQVNSDSLQQVYDGIIGALDESKKSLIPEQLNLAEKISYLSKNKETFVTIPTIITPLKETEIKTDGGLFGGKYKTLDEWSIADPRAYIEYRRKEK